MLYRSFLTTCLLLAVALASACSNNEEVKAASEKKEEAPKVSLANEEKLAQLIKEGKGKVVVLNFWATWCPPCVKEMPDFAKFYKQMDKEKVAFISLSANEAGKYEEQVVPYQKKEKLPFDIYVLNANDPDKFAKALGVELSGALPCTIIYDEKGIPTHIWERDTDYDELKETIDKMI